MSTFLLFLNAIAPLLWAIAAFISLICGDKLSFLLCLGLFYLSAIFNKVDP